MKRGEIWTAAGGIGYLGKPRPAVILQDDRFDSTDSTTICGLTTDSKDAPLFRIPVRPTERNGLREACWIMVDKITAVRRVNLGRRIGILDDDDILRLNRAVLVFLGLGSSSR